MIAEKILALSSLSLILQLNIDIHNASWYLTRALYFIVCVIIIILIHASLN